MNKATANFKMLVDQWVQAATDNDRQQTVESEAHEGLCYDLMVNYERLNWDQIDFRSLGHPSGNLQRIN